MDNVFYCPVCKTMHVREPDGPKVVVYEIAAIRTQPQGQPIYVPFWKMPTIVNIYHESVEGGFFLDLVHNTPKGGAIVLYLPAVEWDVNVYKYWAETLTKQQITYALAEDFGGVPRMPVNILRDEAGRLADFLVLTFEAERPGVMQSISYDLQIQSLILVYIPFAQVGSQFVCLI
ncbi:MAG: hypothetical protein DRH04_07925 [Deltaproteobacteria bacterium]|nr:MAG: hypothetical protein DRH04_07925 [Deltaproteobacteria bacterium]